MFKINLNHKMIIRQYKNQGRKIKEVWHRLPKKIYHPPFLSKSKDLKMKG